MSFQEMLLEGVAAPELMQHGLTLEEERAASSAPQVANESCIRLVSDSQVFWGYSAAVGLDALLGL